MKVFRLPWRSLSLPLPLWSVLLVSCGTPAVITSPLCQHPLEFSPMKSSAQSDLHVEQTSLSFFGSSLADQLAISPCELLLSSGKNKSLNVGVTVEEIERGEGEEEGNKLALKEMDITTSYTWSDVLLNLIPFYGSRTVMIRGNYEHTVDEDETTPLKDKDKDKDKRNGHGKVNIRERREAVQEEEEGNASEEDHDPESVTPVQNDEVQEEGKRAKEEVKTEEEIQDLREMKEMGDPEETLE